MAIESRVRISDTAGIVTARQQGRTLALELGFEGSDLTVIATAISEVARNILDHAKSGEVIISRYHQGGKRGICVIACDSGPGIADIEQAMQYGYSTRNGLGIGLPGAKLLMDEFHIKSTVGLGTTITMRKWMH